MISSIFGRTKPINFIILTGFAFVFLIMSYIFIWDNAFSINLLIRIFVEIILVLFMLLLIDFINRKNHFTSNNSYLNLFFVLFLCMFPRIFTDIQILLSNIFVLLAFRRMVSMRSGLHVRMKIFDASIWICVAAFFYSWAILFLVLVFVGIFLYGSNSYKNLMVPFVSILIVGILTYAYYLYFGSSLNFEVYKLVQPDINIQKYGNLKYIIPIGFLLGLGAISSLFYFIKIKTSGYKSQIPGTLLLVYLGIGIMIAMVAEDATSSELIYIGFPLTVIMTKYMETIQKKWLREIILWMFVAMPFVLLFL